uniref:asparagine synthase (glutamine-hydrolyzing) n=1 Tax=Altererythrobacter segetis TaxID=1104773 RepID=UPI00140D807B|nr:asparagine synthase (glutamine-hydrolyzing) [Altererythrobacter segetis]
MCGIVGFLGPTAREEAGISLVRRMSAKIDHRGPDDSGAWIDTEAGVALGHCRLAIIDLSPAGHQPMTSASGRYVIVYNGEIYNFPDLRQTLEESGAAGPWRGHSDTEVLLAAIEHWGVEGALAHLNGMFAFALWDRRVRKMILARDRVGEKPLYYGRSKGTTLFGSELKALQEHPDFRGELDRQALTSFFRFNYIPAPRSIWTGIAKLLPGHYVEIDGASGEIGEPRAYWSLREVALAGASEPFPNTPDLVDRLEALLLDAVGIRMTADVPLGAFLSGGVDSATIVAMMQAQSTRPVQTFTIGFDEARFNEAEHARAVAEHLGTEHTELYVRPRDALDLVPRMPRIWDEPFSDSSQIPTLLLSELTRRHVTVSLSDDAGDELFGGYNRYVLGARIWNALSRVPRSARGALSAVLSAHLTGRVANSISSVVPQLRNLNFGDRLPKVAQILKEYTQEAVYRRLASHTDKPAELVVGGQEPKVWGSQIPEFADFREWMMYLDTLTYLPDDILVKVDRASMATSLESRVPFLDPRLIEFAWKVPMSAKIRGSTGKHILRQVLDRHVPRNLIDRPKMGFGVPIEEWLRGPLRDWASALLDPSRLRQEGYLNPSPIEKMWSEHSTGARRWHYQLWDVLMFQAWLENATTNASSSFGDLDTPSSGGELRIELAEQA